MKTCPQCGQQFSDDNSFCLDDGSVLVVPAHTPSRGTGDQPTQVLTTAPVVIASSNKGVLYAFVGILLLVIGGMASYIAFRPGDDSDKFQTVSTTKANTQSETPAPAPPPNTVVTPAANAPPPISRPAATANGRWSGDWTTASGAYLNVVFTLNDDGNGRVNGQIDWTLRRTSRPDKMSKIGMSAIEFVNGNFDPVTRKLSLQGYRKDDPNGVLVMLDQYSLTLSPDDRRLTGSAKNGGKWNARINAAR